MEKAPDNQGLGHKQLSRATGGTMLGCSLYILAPGVESWPYHYYPGNEEAIYILCGRGTVGLADSNLDVQEGDYVRFLKEEVGVHRVSNSSNEELRYLCFSTMVDLDVAIYPDANMIGVFAGAPPRGEEDDHTFKRFLRADVEVDYWGAER